MFRKKKRAKRIMNGLNDIVKGAAKSPTGKEIKKALRGYSRQLAAVKMPKISVSR